MHKRTKKVHLAASEMLVPAEMHLRPAEMCLVGAGMMVTAEMHLMLTEVLRRCTVARHPLMPQGHICRHQCLASARHTSSDFRCISAGTNV